jgi:hypothetical protein
MWHRVSTPPVLAWFLGATSSWNEIMDLLWVRLQGERLEFGQDRVGAPRTDGAVYHGYGAGSESDNRPAANAGVTQLTDKFDNGRSSRGAKCRHACVRRAPRRTLDRGRW